MTDPTQFSASWSDRQLPAAVATATSWRGVMRNLGLNPSNGGTTRTIRRRAALLGLDTAHFRGNRSWSDAVLRKAVIEGRTWDQVLTALGLKAQADLKPDLAHLRRAAESLATTWFLLCGHNVAVPVVPDSYDLLVDMPDGPKRVQVKTTTYQGKEGWIVQIGRRPYALGNNALLVPYDPEIIELFFIVDGDLSIYLIPSRVIGGRVQILLRTYRNFIIGNAAGLMHLQPPAA